MTTDKRWIKEKTSNPGMCKECGGRCCKKCGCSHFPEDLNMTFENIVKEIKERKMSIDRLEHEGYVAYGNIGRCVFLTEEGCKLDYESRPSGGRYIVPFWSGCYALYTPQEFIDKWIPYQKLLKDLIKFFS